MRTSLEIDNIELSIEDKFIGNRDGSRGGYNLAETLIGDICHLLRIDEPELTDKEQESIHDSARKYEDMLCSEGYTVVWNDGYFIYKDLTDEELEYLSEVY